MRQPLTARQRQIYDFIVERVQSGNLTPSMREIGSNFGIVSTNGVARHLEALQKKGWVELVPGKARAIKLPGLSSARVARAPEGARSFTVPLLGRVAAGTGVLAAENREGDVLVDPDLFGGTDSFALRVQGDSMIEAGIHPGDLVIVRPQRTAHNGDVVVALIDDEDATVKFYHDKGRYLELRPANEAYEPIVIPKDNLNLMILGKVIGLMRRY